MEMKTDTEITLNKRRPFNAATEKARPATNNMP
jgi:hypothetical protein